MERGIIPYSFLCNLRKCTVALFLLTWIVSSLKKEKRQQTLEISNHIRFLSGKVYFLVGF